MQLIDRRQFLRATGRAALGLGALYLVRCTNSAEPPWDEVVDGEAGDVAARFPQGIASGDPRPDGMLLWTRAPGDGAVAVEFRLARDAKLTDVVGHGLVPAGPEDDWTVRVRLENLEPGTTYYYRFIVDGVPSALGRTRTAPDPDSDVDVRFAVTSCQDYVGRYYHGWRALAEADDVDFVLFLGDYIYEYTRYPGLQEPTAERFVELTDGLVIDEAEGVLAALSLEDYRGIYRAVQSDPDLQEARRLFPFVIAWDDHEFANDAWADHAVDFNEAQGDEKSTARREAATRAWFEHVPIDIAFDAAAGFPDDVQTYRRLRWGKRLDIFLTDERYFRDDHVIPEGPLDAPVGKALANSPLGSRIFAKKAAFDIREADASPTMLGATQKQWLVDGIRASDADWKVFGSALLVAEMAIDLSEFETVPPIFRDVFYFKLDHWDGYRTERAEILEALADVENLVVLSGDLHGFWAAEVKPDFETERVTAVEFTVAGMSSISLGEQIAEIVSSEPLLEMTGLGEVVDDLDNVFMASNPHFLFSDSFSYGFGVASVSAEGFGMQLRLIPNPRDPNYAGIIATHDFRVAPGHAEIVVR